MMEVTTRFFTIPYGQKQIEAACTVGQQVSPVSRTAVILTHGAGGDMRLSQLEKLTTCLADHGFTVIRFTCKGLNLVYRVKVYVEVLKYVHENYSSITGCFVGGRSMGARAAVGACLAVTESSPLSSWILGVVCLSYPLHTPDNTSSLRDGPLLQFNKPVCFVSGNQDKMCKVDLLKKTLKTIPVTEVMWIDGADHGIKVKGRSEDDIVEEISDFLVKWCQYYMNGKCQIKPVTDQKTGTSKQAEHGACLTGSKQTKSRKRKRDL